ncbi:MAG TPA: N4-gp56 family major capsid protein [Ignavibacteria bacterium]|nr:N4-gp56 family major capsid protein [Ignavibacteria bacterium]
MAQTKFYTGDNLTRKRWAKDLFRVILDDMEYKSMVGTSNTSAVQVRTELPKGAGDRITFGIRRPLTGAGIVGDQTWEGNEEKLSFKDFNMTVEELGHGVEVGGEMEAQRVPYNLVEEGKDALRDWWGQHLSDHMFAHFCGDTTYKVNGVVFAQAPTNPDSGHQMFMNGAASEAALVAGDQLDLGFLDAMKQRAEAPEPALNQDIMRAFIIGGKKYYRVVLHDYAYDNLRRSFNVGDYGDMLRAAKELKQPDVDFVYNGMMVSKSTRIRTTRTISGNQKVYRNILFGPQALCVAWGGAGKSTGTVMNLVVKQKDYDRITTMFGGGIFGFKKTGFGGKDYGIIVGSSAAEPLSA